jgi:hypothetical protein
MVTTSTDGLAYAYKIGSQSRFDLLFVFAVVLRLRRMFNGLYDRARSTEHAIQSVTLTDREDISNHQRWHGMRTAVEVKVMKG